MGAGRKETGVSETSATMATDSANTAECADERLKLFISTPFRSFGTRRLFPDSLFGVGDELKDAYVDALVAEIGAAAYGTDGMLVDEIEFGYGPASSLSSEQLGRVMRAVRGSFRVAGDARIHGADVPGGVTVDHAGFCKNNRVEYLELELLSSDALALHAEGLPPANEAVLACFQVTYFTGGPQLGILLDARLDCDLRAFRRSVTEALGRSPLFVRTVGLDESADADGYRAGLRELCAGHGLVEVGAGALASLGTAVFAQKGFRGLPAAHACQIGCGLNAVSVFDGVHFKSTDDLACYLAHSADFSAIAHRV